MGLYSNQPNSLPEKQQESIKKPQAPEKKAPKTKEEIYRLKKAISFIAKYYAQYGIEVLPLPKNDPEQAWKCSFDGSKDEYLHGELVRFLETKETDSLDHVNDALFKPQTIFYVEDQIAETEEDVLMATLDHETWHAVHDNYKYGFQNMRQAMDEGYLPSSMGLIANGLADGRITYLGVGESEIKRRKQIKLHEDYIGSVERWHKNPVTRQIALLVKLKMVKDFLGMMSEKEFEEARKSLSPDVQKVFNKIEPAVAQYFVSNAEEANIILTKQIWPEYKVLEQQAVQDKEIENLMDQAQASGQGDNSSPFNNLPPDLQDQIKKEIERQNQPRSGQQEESQEGESSSPGGQSQENQDQSGAKEEQTQDEDKKTDQKEGSEGQEDGERKPASGEQSNQDQESDSDEQEGENQEGGQNEEGEASKGSVGQEDENHADQDKELGNETPDAGNQDKESGSGEQGGENQEEKQDKGEELEDISKDTQVKIGEAMKNKPIDINQIPDDLKQKIKEAIDGLSDKEKKELAEKARAELDGEQSEQLNEDMPSIMQMKKGKNGEYRPDLNTAMSSDAEKAKEEIDEFERQEKVDERRKEELRDQIDQAKRPDQIDDLLKNEDMPWQHKDEIEEKAKARREQLEKERANKIKNMKNNGFIEGDQEQPTIEEEILFDEYNTLLQEVKPDIVKFTRMMERILPKKTSIQYGNINRRSGSKLDVRALGKYDKRLQGKVIKSREIKESSEARMMVGFLLDISMSMCGDKLKESLKTLLLFALGLEKFDVDLAIYLFDDYTEKVVKFGKQFSEQPRMKYELMKMLTSIRNNKVVYTGRGGTDMGEAIWQMNNDLNEHKKNYPDYMSALFAISDGETFGALQDDKLTRFINGWNEYNGEGVRSKHLAMGFFLRGLQGASQHEIDQITPMEQYFGERGKGTVVVDDYSSLLKEAFTVLRVSINKMTRKLRINND